MSEKTETPAGRGGGEEDVAISNDRDSIHKVSVEDIQVGARARSIKPDTIEALVESEVAV